MKIGLRAGHTPNVKGAVGYVDEYNECIKIYRELESILAHHGHTVIDCNTKALTQNSDLAQGVKIANDNKVDYFITLHMNAFTSSSADGVECWTYNSKSKSNTIAKRIVKNISSKGFDSRGVKHSTKYSDLRTSHMPAIIVEQLFVTSKKDTDQYKKLGFKTMARLIANAIDTKIPLNVASSSSETLYRVIVGSFSSLDDAKTEVKNAKSKGYKDAWITTYKKEK